MPLPSWRTGTTAQAAHACNRQLVLPIAALCLSRHRESNPMPASPVAVRHGERSAQGVCFFLPRSCRGAHFIGPWLVVDVRFDVWFETRGDAREPRGVERFVGVLEVFRGRSSADWCFVVRQWSGGASRPIWPIVRRPSSLRGRRGRAVSKVPRLFIRQSLGMRIDAVHQFLKNLAH